MISKLKTGIKTTEFWMGAITIVGILIPTISGLVSYDLWVKISGAIVVGYTIARSIVKITPNKIDDEFIAKIESDIISKIDKEIKKK